MNILILAEHPNWITANTSSLKTFLQSKKLDGHDVFVLYQEIDPSANLCCYKGVRESFASFFFFDHFTVRSFYRTTKSFIRSLRFAFGKALHVFLSRLCGYSYGEVVHMRRLALRIINEKKIDRVICFSNASKTRVRSLFGLEKYCRLFIQWFELPDSIVDERFYSRLNKSITMNFVRECDKPFFSQKLDSRKIHIVEFPSFLPEACTKPIRTSSPVFGYFGVFHPIIREPECLLALAKWNPDCSFRLYTNKARLFSLLHGQTLPANVVVRPPVQYEQLLSEIDSCDCLINIENKRGPFSPSKLPMYVSSCKPIVSIGRPGKYLRDLLLKCYVSYFETDNELTDFNELRFREFIKNADYSQRERIEIFFKAFTTDYICDQLLADY